jgi:hypothetical protein
MKNLRHIMQALLALGLGLAATCLWAAPATIKDCEKIQAADAYNRCLASFGPVAHERHLMPVPIGANEHTYASRRRGSAMAITRHGRRKHMILSVDPNAAD